MDLRSNAIDTSHALRTSERATPQGVPPNLQVDFKLSLALYLHRLLCLVIWVVCVVIRDLSN